MTVRIDPTALTALLREGSERPRGQVSQPVQEEDGATGALLDEDESFDQWLALRNATPSAANP